MRTWPTQDAAHDARLKRQRRGAELAGQVQYVGGTVYTVPSATVEREYVVNLKARTCTCPDFQQCNGDTDTVYCKHIYACLIATGRLRTKPA